MGGKMPAPTVEIVRTPASAGRQKARRQEERKQRRLGSGKDHRQLADLISIGPAMVRDFEMLGIRSVAELAKQEPRRIYERLGRMMGQRQDPCVLDTFCAAVAQARDPRLPAEKCQWWYWSRVRKTETQKSKLETKNPKIETRKLQ